MESFLHASGISKIKSGMPKERIGILPEPMPKRLSLGKYLEHIRLQELDLTLKEAKERADRYRAEVGANTIRDIELEKTLNPGILTVEAIAKAYDRSPLEVIAHGLSDPPELDPAYEESRWAAFWKKYSELPAKEKRFFNDYIEMLMERLSR